MHMHIKRLRVPQWSPFDTECILVVSRRKPLLDLSWWEGRDECFEVGECLFMDAFDGWQKVFEFNLVSGASATHPNLDSAVLTVQ